MDKGEDASTTMLLRSAMIGLENIFPGQAVVLMIAPVGVAVGEVKYVTNACLDGMRATLKEVVAQMEGRAHDAPAALQ